MRISRITFQRLAVLSALGLTAAVLFSCAGGRGAPEPTSMMAANAGPAVDLPTLRKGREVYVRHCLRCHDRVPKVPPLGQPWHSSSVMGAEGLYHKLSDVERFQVHEYVKAVERRYFSMKVGLVESRTKPAQ